ncbi:MAG: aromatic ring-hydroxylating dioxygenase subunit alpha [Alphaproteobacteria bacterium]|nr:aromatic ring-hydroxylating dioxygenase subunit alpha [Alphaproteobacteria bacterium]
MYVMNTWYVAAFGEELGDGLLARTYLDRPVVLYRRPDGTPVALEDRCCHRSLPLSLGRIEGANVRCGYHGLLFAPDGRCIEVPGQNTIPPGAQVPALPVVERHGYLWLWPGDAAKADPATIPDIAWNADPAWVKTGDYWHLKCNYELFNDISLDATHATYVHPATLGSAAIQDTPPRIERDGGVVRISRWILGCPAPPIWAAAGGFDGPVDRWILATFIAPTGSCFDMGAAVAGSGAPEGDRSRGISNRTAHFVTPETARSSHYFWRFGRNYRTDDAALSETVHANIRRTFEEDIVILEAQQKALGDRLDPRRIDVNADIATLQARRLVERLLAAEA